VGAAPFGTLMLSFVTLEFLALSTFPSELHATMHASAAIRTTDRL